MMAIFHSAVTSILGMFQLVLACGFVYAKTKSGAPFTDAETTLVSGLLIGGLKGLASADAKKDPP